MRVLVVNAGSSSLKLRLLAPDDEVLEAADLGPAEPVEALARVLRAWPPPDVTGHRVVHGGPASGPVLVDAAVRTRLADLTALAPLHQPPALAGLDAVTALLPGTPAVACFDTAFHAELPAAASTYALPAQWRERYGLRRYGFHGLSHAYCATRTPELLGRSVPRLVSCHLGAGASLAAVLEGRSVDTTMGFTPLEGLVMATRSGTVDPGLVLWLITHGGLSAADVSAGLEKQSGLLALAGHADLREVEAAALVGEERARLAIEVYVHRLAAGIASQTAALGGLDALAFTGGVGEGSERVRALVCARLAYLGVQLDPDRNADAQPDREIGAGRVGVVVLHAREDLQIAREVRRLLRPEEQPGAGRAAR